MKRANLWHGTSRNERDAARRQRLLAAALELYGTQGFRETSVQSLCKESGVSSRSFYELFATQDALLDQLYEDLTTEIVQALSELSLDEKTSMFHAARQFVAAALGPVLGDERKLRVLEIEAVGASPVIEQKRRETMLTLANAVTEAFSLLVQSYGAGRPFAPQQLHRDSDPQLTSLLVVGGMTEILIQRVHAPKSQRNSSDEFFDEMTRVILRAYGVDPNNGDIG